MVQYLTYLAIRHIFLLYILYVRPCGWVDGWLSLCVSCSKYTFSSAFWCHISTPCIHIYTLLILWPNPMNFILFNFVHWIRRRIKTLILNRVFSSFFFSFLSSIPSLILPHCSLFFIKTVYICACVWYDDGQQAENKKEESESHAHTNRIEFQNDNIIIRKGAPKYWIDWKTLSSPLLSASATPHMIHTRSTHIGQWCNTRSIIYLSGWCFECSTFIHHKKSFVLSMSICKPSVTTSINIHHQNHHHHCRHHNQSINNNNNNKKEKYNWIVLLAPFKFCAFAFAWRKILFLSFIFQQLMLSHLLLPSLPHGLHFVRTANMKCHLHNPNFSSWTFKSNQIKPNKQHQISPESVNCIKTEWKQNCDANGWLSLRYTIKVEISDYFFPFANFIPYHIV